MAVHPVGRWLARPGSRGGRGVLCGCLGGLGIPSEPRLWGWAPSPAPLEDRRVREGS